MKSRHNIKESFYSPTNIGRNTLFSSLSFTGKDPRNGWRTPQNKIKCNEQRDEETGYSYHSARYYDPDLSGLWLSVDPMADKYPGINPYAYCAWNPMKPVDPDGKDVYRLDNETGSLILHKWTKEKYDIIEAGTITPIGRTNHFMKKSELETASTMRNTYGISTFVLVSRKRGTVLYNENGMISPYVGRLPNSVHMNYQFQ